PVPRHADGVFGKNGGFVHVALPQAHTTAVFEINRRNDDHRVGIAWVVYESVSVRSVLSCSVSGFPGHEVRQQPQPGRLAFFGVELDRKNVIPAYRTGKG